MRIIFKVLTAPLVVVLVVGTAVLAFLCGVAEWLLNIVSGLIVLLAIGFFIDQQFANGGIALAMAFVCSPVGLPKSRKNVPKVLSDRDINYDKTKNPRAGPFWDRRMMAAEGKQIAADTQAYVNRKAGKR